MPELLASQQRVRVYELREGDFLDVLEPVQWRGPRGGRYRFDGVRWESRLTKVEQRGGSLVLYSRAYPAIRIPHDVVGHATAIVRRKEVG